MLPRMNSSLPPLFRDLQEYPFQELCCDLFEKQEGIATCEIYGVRGQKQFGVDLLAHCKDRSSTEVGQCKCQETITPGQMVQASDNFLLHIQHWKQRRVKRFILFVACDLDNTQQQEEILIQKARFVSEGIVYEAWSSRTLRQKLSPHRDIVSRHISSQEIVNQICGPLVQTTTALYIQDRAAAISIDALGSKLENLATQLSREKARRLDDIREKYREGKCDEAYCQVESLQREETYELLDNSLKARILRILATYTLNKNGEVAKAKGLADQARQLDPEADASILSILLSYRAQGASSALASLPIPTNIDLLNFRLALLLELGKTDEILSIMALKANGLQEDAETRRVYTWALLISGDITGAQVQIQKAVSEQPNWQSIRVMSAMVDYFSGLSLAATPKEPIMWPNPVDWAFVKRDHESQTRLRRAQASFAELSLNAENSQRGTFRFWQFASLANDAEKQIEAETLCQNILLDDPCDRLTIMWAIARRFRVDLAASRTALEKSIQESSL